MAVVAFDYGVWAMRYPELASRANDVLAGLYFDEACLYCDNSDGSIVSDVARRSLILGMLTAHIAAMNAPAAAGVAASDLVGRISSATQGSVTVQTTMDLPPGSAQWFAQTKHGAAAWQALAPYRTARYIPGPTRNMNPFFRG